MPINLVLIGPPGSGKGTQAVRLARRYAIPHISTGDILRDAVRSGSALGREVGALMNRGELVGDELMRSLVRERLGQSDARAGWLLDGFPRTVVQAHALDELLHGAPLLVALIDVPDDEIVRRLGSRRICTSCRLTQSVFDAPDGQIEACPYCGGSLVCRDDDNPETVRRRLATYTTFAAPLIEHYRPRPGFIAVNGLQEPDAVATAMFSAIDER